MGKTVGKKGERLSRRKVVPSALGGVALLPAGGAGSKGEEGVTSALLWGQLQLLAIALVAALVIWTFLVKKEGFGTIKVN